MKLTVFQSDKGDCLMLESGGKRMLVDGGMRDSYARHVAPTLGELEKTGKKLDVVYVSHIDRDHVFGVLQMMEDLVDWRVYDFHQTAQGGNRDWPKPKVKRPPDIGGIWHNSFHDLVGRNAGPIGDQLAASTHALSGFADGQLNGLLETYGNLASSMTDAVALSRRVGPRQLGIPINAAFEGKLVLRRDAQPPVRFGNTKIHVIGPSASDLRKLRQKWNKWLESEMGERQLGRINRAHRRDEEVLELANVGDLLALRQSHAEELGKRSKVTLPNLASLMLLVEEGDKSILLTGDGHWKDILDGLEECGKLACDGSLHLNILKVQHHGSEHNLHPDFCKRVTADHYIFCGNGAHENPDGRVIDVLAKSRIGGPQERSLNQQAGADCIFWFNSSPNYRFGKSKNKAHMREIEQKMEQMQLLSGGQIKSRFLKGDKFEITL
jgi:beta-lactamase superfamily II metal-dependent hydrolase